MGGIKLSPHLCSNDSDRPARKEKRVHKKRIIFVYEHYTSMPHNDLWYSPWARLARNYLRRVQFVQVAHRSEKQAGDLQDGRARVLIPFGIKAFLRSNECT
jgi:hypothetical protein